MEQYNIGRVISRTFALIRDTATGVGLFVLLVQIIMVALTAVMMLPLAALAKGPTPGGDPFPLLAVYAAPSVWGSILASMFLSAFSMAGTIQGMLASGTGQRASVQDCMAAGIKGMLPMLGLIILWWIAIVFGFVLLVVPGIILVTMLCVAQPALVGEGVGVFGSFGRSRELTKGSRWLVLVTLLFILVIEYGFQVVGRGLSGSSTVFANPPPNETLAQFTSPVHLAILFVTSTIAALLNAALVVSMYRELRLVKGEGETGHHLAEIFS